MKYDKKAIMTEAWSFIRKYGASLAEALATAWRNAKLKAVMRTRTVRFHFQKVDGTIREAWGTLAEGGVPQTKGAGRKSSDTVQVYYDTEKEEFRSFKKFNLISVSI